METQGNEGQGATKTETQTWRTETQRQNLRQGAQERAEPTHQLADGVREGGRDGAVAEGAVRGSTKAGAEQQQQQQGGLGAGSPLLTPHPPIQAPPFFPLSPIPRLSPFLPVLSPLHYLPSDCSPRTLCPYFSLCFCSMPSSLLSPMSRSVPTSPTWHIDLSLCSPLPVIFSVYLSAVLCSSLHWGPIFPICTHLPVSSPNPCPSPPLLSISLHFSSSPPTRSISLHLPPSAPTRSMSLHLHPPPPPVCLSYFCPSPSTHLSPSTSIHLPHPGPSPHLCPCPSTSIRPSFPCPSPHFSASPLSALPF